MTRIAFYKHRRNDGGTRWGILVDDASPWTRFEEGSGLDSSLLWYILVQFQVESWNGDSEAARRLFLDHADLIRKALVDVITALQAETDVLVWPISPPEVALKPGLNLQVIFSAVRRIQPREVLPALIDLERNWERHIESLELVKKRRRVTVPK